MGSGFSIADLARGLARTTLVVELALVLAIAAVVADIVWSPFAPSVAARDGAGPVFGGAEGPTLEVNAQVLRVYNPFKRTVEVAAPVIEQPRARQTRLQLKLKGTIVERSRGEHAGRAQIQVPGGQWQSFRDGDLVTGNVTLLEVHDNHVILNNNGALERLEMRRLDSVIRPISTDAAPAPATLGVIDQTADDVSPDDTSGEDTSGEVLAQRAAPSINQTDPNQTDLNQTDLGKASAGNGVSTAAAIDDAAGGNTDHVAGGTGSGAPNQPIHLNAPGELILSVNAVETTLDDGQSGVVLAPRGDAGQFAALGLQDGDVLYAIDGVRIQSAADIFVMAEQMVKTSRFSIEVLRGGRTQIIDYWVQRD